MKKFFVVIMGISLFSLNLGCNGHHHHHEPGATHYSMLGEFFSTEKIPFERAWRGSLKAMKELEFVVTKQEKDALTAVLIARGANDKRIEVSLKKQSEKLTEIRILVGTFGDESLSRLILEKIKARA